MRRPLTALLALALLGLLGSSHTASAQETTPQYPAMAPIEQYQMDRTAEIALARSAAPASIADSATILVLGRTGFDTAATGTNGFVCMVDRGWNGPLDWPEFWSPKIRAPACMNPQAAHSILPIMLLRTRMVLAGRSTADILSTLKSAFAHAQLPRLEHGGMAYMMSPSAYLTDMGGHNAAHVMFYTDVRSSDWGAGAEGSPLMASPYWYFMPQSASQLQGLPTMTVFLVGTATWSDGTPVEQHAE
jgi:hypothetical protein